MGDIRTDSDRSTGDTGRDFLAIYCQLRGVAERRFEERVLCEGTVVLLRPIVFLLLRVCPNLFRIELEYLRGLGEVRTRRQFASEMGVISDFNQYQLPLWRGMLGLRTSTRRLSKLRKLLPRSSRSKSTSG